jgi:undecaprenyl diphosphate synthase
LSQANYPPQHIAIIMDGNGRWAKKRGLPRIAGHQAGGNNIQPTIRSLINHGVKYLTLYTFSTENWSRPRTEVSGLINLLTQRIDRETESLHQENVRLIHIGKTNKLPEKLKQKLSAAISLTNNNTAFTLCLAFDYGGRDEIVQAAKHIIDAGLSSTELDETVFSQYLYATGLPNPDLIIRTGGERRLSNFLLWQAAYSELYFTPVLWPDFNQEEIEKALLEYKQRQRRFGAI